MTFTNCRHDENSSFLERLSWTWVPPLSFSTTDESATVPAATTTGIDIDAVILANVIFIVIVVEQRRVRRLAFALGDVLWRPVVNGSREGAMLPPTMLPRQRWRLPGL